MKRALSIAFLLVLLPCLAFSQGMPGPYMQISGVVITSRGMPIPGCIVQLQNQEVGASYPVSTGAAGDYYFPQVPTQVRTLYIIQVFWNGNVIYNGLVYQPGLQPPITIPVP